MQFRGIEKEIIQSGDEISYFKFLITNNKSHSISIKLFDGFTKSGLPLATNVDYVMNFKDQWWSLNYVKHMRGSEYFLESGASIMVAVGANQIIDLGEDGQKFIVRIGQIKSFPFQFNASNLSISSPEEFPQVFRLLVENTKKNGECIAMVAGTSGATRSIKFIQVRPRIVLSEFVFRFEGDLVYLQDEKVDVSKLKGVLKRSLGNNDVIFEQSEITKGSKKTIVEVINQLIDSGIKVIELNFEQSG